jgi:SAM-dependent methyltransferase
MTFDQVIGTTTRWQAQVEALAALGAALTLELSDTKAPDELADALHGVIAAAGLGDVSELAPPQQALVLSLVRSTLLQAADLVDDPGRPLGWAFTDPAILDGWGRGSTMIPGIIAAAHDDLRDVDAFLDVGVGVGLLAITAANTWPTASVVGVDVWEPSLARARANVADAKLQDRIELRAVDVVDLDEVDRYDCVWLPSFFLTEEALARALPALVRATRPGGWIALGRFASPPDPLAQAVLSLRTVRAGGCNLERERAVELLQTSGCESVHEAPRAHPAPLELVLGQRPR